MNDTAESPVLENRRWHFSLRDLLVLMVALGVLFALLAHWVNVTREQTRQKECVENLKNLAYAVHHHYDGQHRFPTLVWDRSRPQVPADRPGPPAGHSWSAAILPYVGEMACYESVKVASSKFTIPPFLVSAPDANGRPVWSSELSAFRCLLYSGPSRAIAHEYARHSGTDGLGKPYGVAISNYVALTATHLDNAIGGSADATPPARNGVVVNTWNVQWRHIVDGVSNTFMLCETRETAYSSWYDGAVGWVVAADPNGVQPVFHGSGFWTTTGRSALTAGPSRQTPNAVYLKGGTLSTMQADRRWGPSSEHASGGVNHAMVDGSVRAIMPDIDPTLYLQLTTRAGREPVSLP